MILYVVSHPLNLLLLLGCAWVVQSPSLSLEPWDSIYGKEGSRMDKDPTHFTKGGVIKPTILSALKAVAFRGLCMSSSLLFFAALALLVYLKRTFPANDDDIWAPPRPTPSRHSPPPPPFSAFFFSIFGVLLSFHVFKLGSSALSLKQRHCTVRCSGFGKLRLISDLWSSLVRHAVTGATLESRPIHFWPFVPSPLLLAQRTEPTKSFSQALPGMANLFRLSA